MVDFSGIQHAFESGLSAAAEAGKQVSRGIGDGAAAVARAGQEVARNVGNGTGNAINGAANVGKEVAKTAGGVVNAASNGMGELGNIVKQASAKMNQEQLLEILELCYGKAVDGIPRVDKSVDELVSDYSSRYPTARKAAEALVANHLVKCTASGVATSFGGVATLPLTVSANVVSVLYFQLRMIAAVAKLGGYDPKTDQVRTMAYVCLAGQSANEVLKSAGVQFGTRFTKASIMKVSGKTITKINRAVGFRLVTRMGKTGVINLHRLVPVVGGIIGGGVDLATTKIIADNAMKMFIAELPDPPAQA